jgi:hypothetical protein
MPEVGEIARWNGQSDVNEQQYRYTRHVGGNRWEIEILPPDDEVYDRILSWTAYREAQGSRTTPIWDKEWSECDTDAGEHPQITGWTTYEQELEKEIRRAEEWAGTRMEIELVSRDEWAKHF